MKGWTIGTALWFVCDNRGTPWLSTGSYTKRGAIKAWNKQNDRPWRHWYRNGYSVQRMQVAWRPKR